MKALGAADPIVLIGHGSGGIAAYHAAELLEKEDGCPIRFIIQVGSPKVPIGDAFKDRVGYMVKKGMGMDGDPISWQGSWSPMKYRYNSHRYPGLLHLSQEKGRRGHAPDKIAQVDIRGRHPGYFSPALGHGPVSNLAVTFNIIWNWISQI